MVSGALLVAEDPGSLVAVDAAGLGWVRADRVESLSRKHLVEQVGALDADLMATVDDRLRAYFSL
jgi:mRNA-degrading endonuclease toxin of MazEF toxin-antitoxin module